MDPRWGSVDGDAAVTPLPTFQEAATGALELREDDVCPALDPLGQPGKRAARSSRLDGVLNLNEWRSVHEGKQGSSELGRSPTASGSKEEGNSNYTSQYQSAQASAEVTSGEGFKGGQEEEEARSGEEGRSAPIVRGEEEADGTTEGRYNFALAKQGAGVVAAGESVKNAESVLSDDTDSYLRVPCKAKAEGEWQTHKWFVIELTEQALVDTIVLANFEHYSSSPRLLRVLTSAASSQGPWETMALLEADANARAQRFVLPSRQWGKFVKLEWLADHGKRSLCTLSTVKVHGRSTLEGVKLEEEEEDRRLFSGEAATASSEPVPTSKGEVAEGNGTGGEGLVAGGVDEAVAGAGGEAGFLKALLQRVRAVESFQRGILDSYFRDINAKYRQAFEEVDISLARLENDVRANSDRHAANLESLSARIRDAESNVRRLASYSSLHASSIASIEERNRALGTGMCFLSTAAVASLLFPRCCRPLLALSLLACGLLLALTSFPQPAP